MHDTQDVSWRAARYHCSICSRPFDRKDTLARHMHVHSTDRMLAKPRRKACLACAQGKTRCHGEKPVCSTCQRRRTTCLYDDIATTGRQQRAHIVAKTQEISSASHQTSSSSSTGKSVSSTPTTELNFPVDGLQLFAKSPNQNFTTHGENDVVQTLGLPEVVISNTLGLPVDLLPMTFDDTDFNSNLDWIMEGNDSMEFLCLPDFFTGLSGEENQNIQTNSIGASQTAILSARQSVTGNDEVVVAATAENADGTEPATDLNGLFSPLPQANGTPGQPWLSESPAVPQKHISLPKLGSEDLLEKHSFPRFFSTTKPVSDRTWQALQECIRLPFKHNSAQTLGCEAFPNKEQLDHCIDLYFASFHPMLAVIHQPTFEPGKDLVITLAMISIGACYTDLCRAKEFSITLSEILRRLLVLLAEHDRRFVRTASFLTAQVLQGTHGYCNGNELLFELSESCRGSLIHYAKCMGLFHFEQSNPPQHVVHGRSSLQDTWKEWIEAERLRRLGWAIYKYDASVAYLHNSRPFLSTGDINLNLPCSAEHWAAESPQAWLSLHPWSRQCPSQPQLRPMIRLLFDGTKDPLHKILDEEHRFIIVLTMVRMLWTLKEIKSSPVNSLVTPPSFDDGRGTLLKAIDVFHTPVVPLSKTLTQLELDRVVHRIQLVHIAHIYGAGDFMNWLYPYLRAGPEAENARVRIRHWADSDPVRVRDVAFRSAQVLASVRHYPSNLPFLPFLIFHAGVVLWCMSASLARPPASDTDQEVPPLQLDLLDAGDGLTLERQLNWVADGTAVRNVCLFGVPSLTSALGPQQVLEQTATLLKRQKVWRVAQNLTKVVLSLASRDIEKNVQQ